MHWVPVLQLRGVQRLPDQVAGHDHCVVVRGADLAVGIDTIDCTVDFDPKMSADFF